MVKRSASRAAALLLGSILASAYPLGAKAESSGGGSFIPRTLPVEAPKSLFAVDLDGEGGDADAELDIRGSWEASLLAEGSLDASGGGLALSEAQPLLFTQRPDLFLSFLLFKKLFVEARVSDDIAEARYSVGYRGGEGEALKEVRVGNDGISFPSLPFLSFGTGSRRSFGASARVETDAFFGSAMLRYDQADRVEKRFVGRSELTETVVAASGFARGRYFATSSGTAANLVIYVESSSGTYSGSDGKTYRRLEAGEYGYSAATGFIALSSAATTRVAASYDSALGDIVSIGGTSCELLHDPDVRYPDGSLEPKRQVLCRYPVLGASSAEVFVRDRASGLRDEVYEARFDSGGFVEVTRNGQTVPTHPDYRTPFLAEMPGLYATDFSEDDPAILALMEAPLLTKEIVVRRLAAAAEITIDKDVIEGSVEVRRNGVPDYAFTVDAGAGLLKLATQPGLEEEIRVSYLRASSERRAGSLAAGLAGVFDLGKESSAWAALGLRWSVPGQSYAEGGTSNPGSVVITAGEEDKEGLLRHKAALAGSWTTEEASGRYRVEGMEGGESYATSLGVVGSLPAGTAVAEIEDAGLGSLFPTYSGETHRDGSPQKALKVSVGATAGDVELSKIVSAAPLEKLKTYSFFAKGPASSSLEVSIDGGSAGTQALSIRLNAGALGSTWRRYLLRYGEGDARVYARDGEDGPLYEVAAATSAIDLSQAAASRLHIAATGLLAGDELWVDEVALEDSTGRAALRFEGELAYSDPELELGPALRLGSESFALFSAPSLKANASAALQEGSYASGALGLGAGLGPLDLKVSLRGSASGEGAALRGGHEAALPLGPLSLADRFDFDPADGSFGKEEGISLEAGSAFGLELRGTTLFSPSALGSGRGSLAQSWGLKLDAARGRVELELKGANASRPASPIGLAGDYFGAWAESFAYILPAAESDADSRSSSLSLAARLDAERELFSASATFAGSPKAAGGAFSDDAARLRAQAPLKLKNGIGLTPYYQRAWTERRDGAGSGILEGSVLALGNLAEARPLWQGLPFAELFDAATLSSFGDYTGPAGAALSKAAYKPEVGLLLSREYGSAWWDLLAPAALSISYGRELSRADSSLTSTGVLEWSAKSGAINLFGAFGAYPAASFFESDEYFQAVQGRFSLVEGESAIRKKLILQELATFYAKGNLDSFAVENRFSYSEEPALTEWSERLNLTLSVTRSRHWLLDLYRLVLPGPPEAGPESADGAAAILDVPAPGADAGRAAASARGGAPAPGAGRKKASIVSLYAEELAKAEPRARTIFGFAGSLAGSRSDASTPEPSFDLEESVQAKLTVPGKLTVTTKAALFQRRDGEDDTFLLGGSLSLGVVISF